MILSLGDFAPAISLPDQSGKQHSLSDDRGQWVLLYFYPKDDTSGCTAEACGFRDRFAELQGKVTVIGVSADPVESHEKFAEKYQLTFTLLSDPDRMAISAYGATKEELGKRVSFLIDPEGKIAKIYRNVDTEKHAGEIIEELGIVSEE